MQHSVAKAIAVAATALGLFVASAGAAPQGSLFDWVAIRMERPEAPDTRFRIEMAYRQANMFVAFLRDTNPVAFAATMRAILDGRPFAEAVETGYHTDVEALWLRFVRSPGL